MKCPGSTWENALLDSHVYCSWTFCALLDLKGNAVAFVERLEARPVDPRMVNEYIRSIFLLNEAVALLVIKPFYRSIGHSDTPLSK